MKVLDGLEEAADCQGGVLAIGNFDGVHRGHQKMLRVLVERANERRVPAVALTFDPAPVQLLRPEAVPPRLSTIQRKRELIESLGVDFLIVYPTDLELLNLGPSEFFEQIVLKKLGAKGLVEGPNFYFGKDRQGDVKLLAKLCARAGRFLDVIEPEYEGDLLISSSTIRRSIADGKLSRGVLMLGHPHRLEGTVIPGEARGRQLGFPTANLSKVATLIPGDGVYGGRCLVNEQSYAAAVHVGTNPTFQENERKVEVHLLDFAGELYGQTIQVDLLERIRGTRVFQSASELKGQIENDLKAIRRLANP